MPFGEGDVLTVCYECRFSSLPAAQLHNARYCSYGYTCTVQSWLLTEPQCIYPIHHQWHSGIKKFNRSSQTTPTRRGFSHDLSTGDHWAPDASIFGNYSKGAVYVIHGDDICSCTFHPGCSLLEIKGHDITCHFLSMFEIYCTSTIHALCTRTCTCSRIISWLVLNAHEHLYVLIERSCLKVKVNGVHLWNLKWVCTVDRFNAEWLDHAEKLKTREKCPCIVVIESRMTSGELVLWLLFFL